jgi:AhpD family alkylhydroperoxidase
MPITKKEKELAAVGISIAAGCKPCTDYHMKAVREAGASDDEIRRAIEDAVVVRNAATFIMRDYGHSHLGNAEHEEAAAKPRDRVAELVGIGAAFAVNCVSSLEKYSGHAEAAGVTREEILEIVKLAKFIKERGASHVNRWTESLEHGQGPNR